MIEKGGGDVLWFSSGWNLQIFPYTIEKLAVALKRDTSYSLLTNHHSWKSPGAYPPDAPRRGFSFFGSLLSEGVKRNCHARKDRNRVATVNIELWSAINVAYWPGASVRCDAAISPESGAKQKRRAHA